MDPKVSSREETLGASSPYLDEMKMTDEKLFQILRFAETFKRFQTNSMKTCGLRVIKDGKSHVTWLFSLVMLGLW